MERERPLFPPLAAFSLAEGFAEVTGADLAKGVFETGGAFVGAGVVLETVFAGSGFVTGAFETGLAGAFLAAGVGLERGDLESGFIAACFAGSGFLTAAFGAGLAGLVSLGAGFFGSAFLTTEVGLTGFPEGFRDGEGLDFFFNVAQLVPKSRARKVR